MRRIALFVGLTTAIVVTTSAGQNRTPVPGTKWTVEDAKRAVSTARAGRKLTPRSWPNGSKVAVNISFDVDNETPSLMRGETAPVLMSSGQYGATTGLPRVLELLDRQKIPASFFIPAVSAQLHPEMIPAIQKRPRHEIGIHGWIHENLNDLNDRAEEERLLKQTIDYYKQLLGKQPAGFRAPSWAFSPYTLELVSNAGFLYDSSMMAMDEPYELIAGGKPISMIELPIEWINDDAPYFGRTGALPAPELIYKTYRDEFDIAYQEGTMYLLTLHPHVSGHRSRIIYLDRLITYMKSKPGVWFATLEEIANYVKKSAASN